MAEALHPADLTVRQVMTELGVSRDTVRRLIRRGELAAYNVSARPQSKRPSLRIRDASVRQFKERRRVLGGLTLDDLLRDL